MLSLPHGSISVGLFHDSGFLISNNQKEKKEEVMVIFP